MSRNQVPSIDDVRSQSDIIVTSPVKSLDLEAANIKLREGATSFAFNDIDGSPGHVDVASVASNDPVEDEWAVGIGRGVGGKRTLFAGIYDGHAGWATAVVVKQALIPYVSNALARLDPSSNNETINSALQEAFRSLDNRIMESAREALGGQLEPGSAAGFSVIAPAVSGSCALLIMYELESSVLRTAVVGDSRAVLGQPSSDTSGFTATALSKDQTGLNEDEVKRLDREHPDEIKDMIDTASGRMLGIAVTRAFGDHRFKWDIEELKSLQRHFFGYEPKPNYKTPPYMTATPEITTHTIATDDFIILASDGLWNVMSNEDAVDCVYRWIKAKQEGKPEPAADEKNSADFTISDEGWPSYKATPDHFVIEDLDNAAVCLVKNALGGSRRDLFCGALTAYNPVSRYVRDDITVQVVFFKDPYNEGNVSIKA